ncbi:hypothetical protein KY361_05625 [Candidatus Woesearchaeota archaeon]|nr:hypothetical protein [Candidatus Woesearchaeota archaeon]
MTLWALRDDPEKGTPTTGDEAIRLRDKLKEEHTYYSPVYPGKSVLIRSGTETHLASRRDHFFLKEEVKNGAERRANAEIGRIGIEAVLRDSGDMYDVGRGRLFREFDTPEWSRSPEPRTSLDTGFDVVYARQRGEGKAPIDYIVLVFDSVPNSRDYWNVVESCFKGGPKNGEEKYVIRSDGRTPALGTGRSTAHRNGKVYVATVLTGNPDNWATGKGSFVADMLTRTGLPLNYYELEEGAMTSIGGNLGGEMRKETTFSLAGKEFAPNTFRVGIKGAHPKLNDRVGLAYFVDQELQQKSLLSDVQGSLF